MKRFCVIGDPISHSKSPEIYRAMCQAQGLDWTYTAQRVTGEGCADFLAQARGGRWDGFNATMPHKELLLPLLDEVAPLAQQAGSVNTVVVNRGRAVGHSTDGVGLVRALDGMAAPWRGETVCLLGAGGAARAVAAALLAGGVGGLIICNRTLAAGEALAARLGGAGISVSGFSTQELAAAAAKSAVVVNCTSLGMGNGGAQFSDLSFVQAMKRGSTVYDMVYVPAETPLLTAAKKQGLRYENGLSMLIHQAIAAMELYLGEALDVAEMERVIRSVVG